MLENHFMFRLSDFALPALGLVVLGALLYSERLTSDTPEPGPVHITYWEKWTAFEFEAMKAVVDDFNREQNKIHVDILSMSGIDQKTLMSVSAGVPPDVAGLYGANVAEYADDHAVEPLDDFCRESGIKRENYIPVYWDIGVYGGHIWALPTTPASTALHYNTDLFRKAGLDPNKPPKTFDELDADADKMTTHKDGRIDVSGFLPAEPGWWNFAWGSFFGGRLWDGDKKITANNPDTVRAMAWIQSYPEKYGAGNLQTFRQGFGNFSSPENAFMEGKDAMEIQGVWMANFIHKFKPDLHWAAAPFPHPADRPDLANMTLVDLDVLVIPRGCKHPKEAKEFIKYVESRPAMEKLCLLQAKHSPLSHVSAHFWKVHPNPYIKLFYDLAFSKNSIPPPKMGMWPEYSQELISAFDSVYLMSKTPQQAMDDVVARIQPKWDQYLARVIQRRREGL